MRSVVLLESLNVSELTTIWNSCSRLDLTAPTRQMGTRKLLREGILFIAKSGRKLRSSLCSDILVLTDNTVKTLYPMVSGIFPIAFCRRYSYWNMVIQPIPLTEVQVKEVGSGRGMRSRCDWWILANKGWPISRWSDFPTHHGVPSWRRLDLPSRYVSAGLPTLDAYDWWCQPEVSGCRKTDLEEACAHTVKYGSLLTRFFPMHTYPL